MSGGQSFNQRVTIPLAVILATVGGLFLIGYKLWKFEPSTPTAQPTSIDSPSASWSPSALPSDSASAVPTADAAGRLPVIVLNGTDTPGLAKTVGDELNNKNWVIQSVDNWTGEPITQTTIYYPEDGLASAEELAAETGAVLVETTPDMSQDALTLVVFK
jgi:hypothetical protein